MKFILLLLLAVSTIAAADTYVRGYTKSNGTYVEPHYRSDANSTISDNWSTKGNTNPYTGQPGYKNPEPSNYNNLYQPPANNNYQYGNDLNR